MSLSEIPEVRYAMSSGGVQIAYEMVGSGDVDVVFALGFLPNLEMSREVSFLRRWLERLTSFARVAHYDRRGVGLSDRDLSMGSPEERMDDIRAVMDAAGMQRAALVTSGDGGPIALMFAATYPDRVASLALYQTWARVAWAHDYPLGTELEELEESSGYLRARGHWGDGTTAEHWVGDSWDPKATRALLARLERTNSSPNVAHEHFRLTFRVDVRAALPSVQAPVLVVARSGLDVSPECPEPAGVGLPLSRWLAEQLGTECHAVPGNWVYSWRDDYEDQVLDLVEEFLLGTAGATHASLQRVLQTLMFTDVVDSTAVAHSLGDTEWRNLLARHDATVRRQITQHRGREVKHTGDGILATFDGPARAVQCAVAIRQALAPTGLQVHTGIHTGECEVHGNDLAGVAVHIAARVCSLAGAGEVLATATVRDLVIGSGLKFEDRGTYELKGIDTHWPIVAALADA
jgi:class 3 adenylate cyclase/pimeloyl-ACP methyl ester carboxylesterase